jgi:hypothetical protein
MTSLALSRFPSLTDSQLTHEELERIDRLMVDYFLPPVAVLDARYDETLQSVADEMSVAPEVWLDCPECCGEGAIEIWESVSKWSIDPPCAHVLPCRDCNGAGGMICEAEGDSHV